MRATLLCVALLLTIAASQGYTACDCGDSSCDDCVGADCNDCGGEMESCDGEMESCDGEIEPCGGETEPCGGMEGCPFGEDLILDDCGAAGGGTASGGISPGNGTPLDGEEEERSKSRLRVVQLTREQAEFVRTSGYYITGVSYNSAGLVDRIEVATYREVNAAGGRQLGLNPFSEGDRKDILQLPVHPNDPKDSRLQKFTRDSKGWIIIPPTKVFADPTARAARRDALYAEVRDLQKRLADADRQRQTNQEGYHGTTDPAAKKRFNAAYWKADANRNALQAQLETKQLQLALAQETGSGGP